MDRKLLLGLVPLALLLACGDDETPDPNADAGAEDAAVADVGIRDTGIMQRPDSGFADPDAGFADPDTLLEGIEYIAGARTYVHMRGTMTSTMPPVVLLNTGPMMGHEYLIGPMDFLLQGRLLVFFDLRATGRSGWGAAGSATITVSAHLDDVGNLLDFIDRKTAEQPIQSRPVDLVGHGYGAGIAALYAADHPEDVSRLVLTAPYPATIRQHADMNAEINSRLSTADRMRILEITRDPSCYGNAQMCTIELWRITGPRHLCPENRDLFDTMDFRFGDFRVDYFFIAEDLRRQEYDWSGRLAQVQAPTTIISGPCDPIPPEAPMVYTSSIAGAESFTLPNTGHYPMVESPNRYQSIVKRALIYP